MRDAMTGTELTSRSTDAEDYQDLPQPVGAMVKRFADGDVIAPHAHARDQLLCAVGGVMRLHTERDALIVPPDRAAFIPAGVEHSVRMHGALEMRTLYIATFGARETVPLVKVLSVSGLLRELIGALCDEAVVYEQGSRADLVARLIQDEIERARELPLSVPLPRDPRLQRLCAAVLADAADRRTLDAWSEIAGASTRPLARLFERDLGISFGDWRRRLRFHRAVEQLSGGTSIAEVARSSGYRSASAFSAAFRKFFGTAPSKLLTARL